MDAGVILAVLLAAALHAGWNALIKINGDRLVVMGMITLFGSIASLPAILMLPLPVPDSWPWLAAAILLHTAYHFFLPYAYAQGDLGQVYPIARGAAPLLVMLGAWLVVGEAVSPLALTGVLCLAAGVMALVCEGGYSFARNPRAVGSALATGAIIASFTIVDGLGARQSGAPLGFAAWVTFADGLITALIVLAVKGRRFFTIAWRHRGAALAGGTMQVSAYWIVVWALTLAQMAAISALRETSVLFAVLLSSFLLKEGLGAWRFVSAALVAAGATMIGQARR